MRASIPKPPSSLAEGQGEAYWWTGELATIKLSADQTEGRLSLVEILAPEGLRIPLHVHRNEDEGFWILEGTVRFEVADRAIVAGPGDFLFGPRDVPHGYLVERGPARMLFLFTPGGFEGFIRDSGTPASEPTLPPPDAPLDLDRVARLAAGYGCELIG